MCPPSYGFGVGQEWFPIDVPSDKCYESLLSGPCIRVKQLGKLLVLLSSPTVLSRL